MEKLWSICIPTYNRSSNLKRNLSYIFQQINNNNKNLIEIIVSNNASTDDTDLVVQEFQEKGMEISYYVNNNNLGFDGNFFQCVKKANGKYVLLLGDDDYLKLGSIDRIINILIDKNYGTVFIGKNISLYNKQDSIITKNSFPNNIQVFSDANEYLKSVSYWLTFISGMVFNKDILGHIDSYIKFSNTSLLQVGIYLRAILKSDENAIMSDSILMTDSNINGGYAFTDVFCKNFNLIMDYYRKEGLEDMTISYINNDMLLHFFPFYLGNIRFGKSRFKDEDSNRILYSFYQNNWRYWIANYPIIKWPKLFGWCWWIGLKIFRKIGII